MLAIDDVLISDEIVEEHFVCDLNKCKGACCVDGDCGAPLTENENNLIPTFYNKIKKYLPEAHQQHIAKNGKTAWDEEFKYVTPAMPTGICVYGFTDELGIVKCAFEKAWKNSEIDFQKPISCHLYPIRVKESEGFTLMNYEPRKKICAPACKLGKQLKIPVFEFLKQPLIRQYGESFYTVLLQLSEKLKGK